MKIAVHFDTKAHKNNYCRRWIEVLKKYQVEVLAIDLRSSSDIIGKIRGCDGVMWHWFHMPDDKQSAPKILQAIELGIGIPVFPNLQTAWHYDEKVAQHYLFDAIKAPKIPTWVFWKYEEALNFIKYCEYPIVFKMSVGAGSANVLKLNNFLEAKDIIDRLFFRGFFPYTINEFAPKPIHGLREKARLVKQALKYFKYGFRREYPPIPGYFMSQKNYAYFQKFLPGNDFDFRITVIGNRAFGLIRHNRPGDFRASSSGNFDVNPENIPEEAVVIAHQISQNSGFQSMAYDFLLSEENHILLSEISYAHPNYMVHDCPGYWDRDLKWHEGHVWSEEAHVEDFIEYVKKSKQQ